MSRFALDPRLAADTLPLLELALCSVRVMDDARWPWLVLVPRRQGASELLDLPAGERALLLDEVTRAGEALRACCRCDKLNIAALGNVVAQLHVHVIARTRDDAAWPRPVWGVGDRLPWDPARLQGLCEALRHRLAP